MNSIKTEIKISDGLSYQAEMMNWRSGNYENDFFAFGVFPREFWLQTKTPLIPQKLPLLLSLFVPAAYFTASLFLVWTSHPFFVFTGLLCFFISAYEYLGFWKLMNFRLEENDN